MCEFWCWFISSAYILLANLNPPLEHLIKVVLNVWTDVAVRTSSWSSDDNKLVEFFRIYMLLTPLRLVLVLQYPTNRSFVVLSTLVRRHDRSFVVLLLEPAINLCLYGDLCNLGVQYRHGRF